MYTILVLLSTLALSGVCCEYQIPTVEVHAFKPNGLRVSIPDYPEMSLFVFHGNINNDIEDSHIGTISAEITEPTNGEWIFEKDNKLNVGDVINYYVTVVVDKKGYVKDGGIFTVRALEDRSQITKDPKCKPSATTVLGRDYVCSGQVLFHDDFRFLNRSSWQVEQRIPINHPEYPFVSYQYHTDVIKVLDDNLRISPMLQQELPGFDEDSITTGTLDLFEKCTEPGDSCILRASGANILPPIVSGRVNTKNSFAFRYGVVEVRAKLPRGDWLYPEILLEPLSHRYGTGHFSSGLIKIATSRGNANLTFEGKQIGNKQLYGGLIADQLQCHDLLLYTKDSNKSWSENFHSYKLRWEPDRVIFYVDEMEWGRFEGNLRARFQNCTSTSQTQSLWAAGTSMAPFDEMFYLTLGVAAGGVTDFPDGCETTANTKPWRNRGTKAKLQFWQQQATWRATWRDQAALQVDSCTVTAL